jgi:hypothetical protein
MSGARHRRPRTHPDVQYFLLVRRGAGDVGRKCIARGIRTTFRTAAVRRRRRHAIGIAKKDPLASQLRDEGVPEIQRRKNLVRKKARAYDGARRSLDQIVRERTSSSSPTTAGSARLRHPSNIEPLFGHRWRRARASKRCAGLRPSTAP